MMSDAGNNSTRNLGIVGTGGSIQLNSSTTDQHLRDLELRNNATASMASGRHLLYVDSLALDPGARLDLADGRMIVTGGASVGNFNGSSYTGITGLLASARNGGAWNGNGIGTSQNTANNYAALGIVSADIVLRNQPTWGGVTPPGSAVLVAYTYGGDANLDGKINVDDYIKIDSGIATGLSGWSNGDFNYDGKVNIDDYTVIDGNIGIQGGALGGSVSNLSSNMSTSALRSSSTQFISAGSEFQQVTSLLPRSDSAGDGLNGVSAVPEPGTILAPLVFGAGMLIRRNRRRRIES